MINLNQIIEENQGYPCYCSLSPTNPCGNLIDKQARVGWKIHPHSRTGRPLEIPIAYHWENWGICCSKECADRVTKSWEKASPEKVKEHIEKIKRDIESFKRSFK